MGEKGLISHKLWDDHQINIYLFYFILFGNKIKIKIFNLLMLW